jgi:hypothetical protein
MQEWESLLHALGGKLEIIKCKIVRFYGNTKPTPKPQSQNSIHITDHETMTQIPLSEISTDNPYKLLGIQIAFNGNQKTQTLSIHSKYEKLAIAFQRCHLSPEETLQGYRSIFLPGILYGMSATNIPDKHLIHSKQLITNTILPKLGYTTTLWRYWSIRSPNRAGHSTRNVPCQSYACKIKRQPKYHYPI